MFERETYQRRRASLAGRLGSGLVLLPGNGESPMNYQDNAYPFRQDSTFLYYIGIDQPDVWAVLDVESGTTTVFGDEFDLDMIVWTGFLPTIAERAERAGITDTRPRSALAGVLASARERGRTVHFLAPYRGEIAIALGGLLGFAPAHAAQQASEALTRAVVADRSYKSAEEVAEIERAVAISVAMHEAAGRMARPGVGEWEITAEVERVAMALGGRIAFPVIATINGQTLHNHIHPNRLEDGRLFLLDSGAETPSGYAGDLTSTFPVSERFSEQQLAIHAILMRSYDAAVAALRPGVPNRDVHFTAARVIFEGMKELGIMKGDTDAALAAGAHALVFPHGLGHMMGLDVHDMENLGEQYVGYAPGEVRSKQFGLKSLRLARALEPGFVLTIEPGIYFIPQLIDAWREQQHCAEFINFAEIEKWKSFGGMRNEEDYLITDSGARRLGPRKPQTVEEIMTLRA